ncbi:MAG: pyridoxamine 5'-phosphate oxidase family protein [Desulfovibrio sp.]|nr:pyridoxamine 5'-phosphate oxidase family protein [Desulfovibrio sp.]
MKRKEREIRDFSAIVDVLRRCGTIRLGLRNGDFPYVVPVSFGLEVVDGKAVVYFHSTPAGLKAACLEKDAHVCVEADIFYKVEPTKIGITARYESVIGFGVAAPVEGEEKLHGLRTLVEHYGYDDYPLDRCRGLKNTVVYKVVLTELTGKRNLPGSD